MEIENVNWLAHRWPIELETQPYGGWIMHLGIVEGHRIGQKSSRAEYEEWREQHRPACLARLIAGWPSVHPPAVVITAGNIRLGRIPPELWCGYDAVRLLDLPAVTLLSAKARAMFPDWPEALIRIVKQDQLRTLCLKPISRDEAEAAA